MKIDKISVEGRSQMTASSTELMITAGSLFACLSGRVGVYCYSNTQRRPGRVTGTLATREKTAAEVFSGVNPKTPVSLNLKCPGQNKANG